MAGISFVKVVDAGNGYTTILASDGKTYTLEGDRNWRNNNPGNLEYGAFAKANGAIGTDGRFAVFPDMQTGRAAQASLQFKSPSYANRSILGAIEKYAPRSENNTSAYANALAYAAGVPISTRLGDLTPAQRSAYLQAQQKVEGLRTGKIKGADGQPVDPAVAQQFSAVRLPPMDIPGAVNSVSSRVGDVSTAPLPFPGILEPPPLPRPRPGYQQSKFDMAPPPVVLNASLPAGGGDYWGPETGRWGPSNFSNAFPPHQPSPLAGAGAVGAAAKYVPGAAPQQQAPIPFPGRPAALDAIDAAAPIAPMQPRLPLQAAPAPPAVSHPLTPPPVRLASGKMIAPGVYPSSDGQHSVQVMDDGAGNAKITQISSPGEIRGFINPLHELNAPTVAGAFIRGKIPDVAANAYSAARDNLGGAVSGVQNVAGNIGSGIGSVFGGLFGQKPATIAPWAPAGPMQFPYQMPPSMPWFPQANMVQQPAPIPRRRPLFAIAAPGGFSLMAPVVASAPRQAAPPAVSNNSSDYRNSDAPTGTLAQQMGSGAVMPASVVNSSRWQTGY